MENNTNNVSLWEIPALAGLTATTPVVERAAGELLFQFGEPCNSLPLVISGNARIYTIDKAGRQIALYCLYRGDVCPISLSALLQHSSYPAAATAESAVQVRYLPGEKLKATITSRPETFSAFLDSFAACLHDSEIATRRLMLHLAQDEEAVESAKHAAQR